MVKSLGPLLDRPVLAGCSNITAEVAVIVFGQGVAKPAAQLMTSQVGRVPGAVRDAGHAATATVVAAGKRYGYRATATPQYSEQLGACLPGSTEISQEEYDARP